MYKIYIIIIFVSFFNYNSIAQWDQLKDSRLVYELKVKKTSFEEILESKTKVISFTIDTVIRLSDTNGYISVLSNFFDPLCFFTTSPKYSGQKREYNYFYNQNILNKYCTFIYVHNDSVSFWNIEKKDKGLFKNTLQIKLLQKYLSSEEILPDASATKIEAAIIRSQPFAMIKTKPIEDSSYYYALLQNTNMNIQNAVTKTADKYVHILDNRHFFEIFFSFKYGILQSHNVVGDGMKNGFVWDLKLIKIEKK